MVINQSDPVSVAVGEAYVRRRGIPAGQVLRVELPDQPELSPADLGSLQAGIAAQMGPQVQALLLVWRRPYAVACHSITSAITLGSDPALCAPKGEICRPGRPHAYYNSHTAMPFSLLGIRPSMLLPARSIAQGLALVERGVLADGQLPTEARPTPTPVAWFEPTTDAARNVRAVRFPPPGMAGEVEVRVQPAAQGRPGPLLLYQTGTVRVQDPGGLDFLPGAVADHLTSFGGHLDGAGQMTALEWLEAGATASAGTVSEPCNYPQKFPDPQVVLQRLLLGETVLEAYWKSVMWPAQTLLVGDPLARPLAAAPRRWAAAATTKPQGPALHAPEDGPKAGDN
ncbi:TIGR03790 family protein [Ideonella livida]|uniref:TIGR03790 family protein n=1 Tax=Ideonella livida TaxID=2707176 RepID=UPI0028731DE2|nr:TIGR03790 family protein [Ideonella livida]